MSESDSEHDDKLDNDLRAALEKAQTKLYKVREEKDRKISELEFRLIKTKDETEQFWQQKLMEVNLQSQAAIDALSKELEKLRDVFSGDASGWEERVTPGGLIIYENKITNETTYEEPQLLAMAKIMRKADKVDEIIRDHEALKLKYKELETKKREGELAINKLKTEINILRKSDKSWKDSAKIIASNLSAVHSMFMMQCDQVENGLELVSKVDRRVHSRIPNIYQVKELVNQFQNTTSEQQTEIYNLNSTIRQQQLDLQDKQKRIEQLSYGLGDELERLTKPMRDRLAEVMSALMKEKANRAHERRELADLWPRDHLMPTLLMQYRSLSDNEVSRRIQTSMNNNIKLAISIDIRAKVAESKLWDMKYDDYGRVYYEHSKSGEVQWEEPEIRRYIPPPGYDTSGNIIDSNQESFEEWKTLVHGNGEVYFQNMRNGEETYTPPYAYSKEPKGKSHEELVGEAAQLVLGYIKSKISEHIEQIKRLQDDELTQLTPEERRAKEKEEIIKERLGLNDTSANPTSPSAGSMTRNVSMYDANNENLTSSYHNTMNSKKRKDEISEDLSVYQYDIETVEMLSWKLDDKFMRAKGKQKEFLKAEKRGFLQDDTVRQYDSDMYTGPTLYETDISKLSIHQIRGIVEYYALMEEKLDKKLIKTRENMKDFSYILMNKINEAESRKESAKETSRKKNQNQRLNDKGRKKIDSDKQEKVNISEKRDRQQDEIVADNPDPKEINSDESDGQERKRFKGNDETIANDDVDRLSVFQDPFADTSEAIASSDIDESTANDVSYVKTYNGLLYNQMKDDDSFDMISKDLTRLCTNLVNFSLFCGYTNTNIDNLPAACFDRLENDPEEGTNKIISPSIIHKDDEWLTASYFLSVNKYSGDDLTKAIASKFDSSGSNNTDIDPDDALGAMDYRDLKDVFGERGASFISTIKKQTRNPWTARISKLHEDFLINHEVWKSRQLISQVLRHQMQQQAIQKAIEIGSFKDHKDALDNQRSSHEGAQIHPPVLQASHPIHSNSRDRMVSVKVMYVNLQNVDWSQWTDTERFYVQFSFGNWKSKSSSKSLVFGDHSIAWGVNPTVNTTKRKIVVTKNKDNQHDKEINQDLFVEIHVPLSRLDYEYIHIDIYRQRDHVADVLLGNCPLSLENAISKSSLGSIFASTMSLSHSSQSIAGIGQLEVKYTVQYIDKDNQSRSVDPMNLLIRRDPMKFPSTNKTHIQLSEDDKQAASMHIKDPLKGVYPMAQMNKLSFASLFDDYASSDGRLLQLVRGHISTEEILQKGYRISMPIGTVSTDLASSDREDVIKKDDTTALISCVRQLPNFSKARSYLHYKSQMIDHELSTIESDISNRYPLIQKAYEDKIQISSKIFSDTNKKYKNYEEDLDRINSEIKKLVDLVAVYKIENKRPKEPIIVEIGQAITIPMIPNIANAREDKTRSVLSTPQITKIIEDIQLGKMDGNDWFAIFSSYRANPNQIKLLTKEIQARNEILELKRQEEISQQNKIIENYNNDILFYEKEEKKRKTELNRLKKELRKFYLKQSICFNCLDHIQKQYQAIELDAQTIREIFEAHQQATDRFLMIKMKQILEKERHQRNIYELKKKLCQLMNQRQRALNLPGSINISKSIPRRDDLSIHSRESNALSKDEMARDDKHHNSESIWNSSVDDKSYQTSLNEIHHSNLMIHDIPHQQKEYLQLCRQAESILSSLEYELVDIKQQLVQEGIYLRNIHEEEYLSRQYECNRLKLLQEIIQQRVAIDQIIKRHQYEILHLYDVKERILLNEAEKDEVGMETINNEGEKYIDPYDQIFQSSNELKQCNKQIDLIQNKFQLTISMNQTASSCQYNILHVISMKWSYDYIPCKYSWCENSDYIRSKELIKDLVCYMNTQEQKLESMEESLTYEKYELISRIQSYERDLSQQRDNYQKEINYITTNTNYVIKSLQNQLEILKMNSEKKQISLEENIKELSNECQSIREQLSSQAMIYDDKNKILYAMVTTQQDTIQHLQAKLENTIDEREKLIIKAKLDFDRLRRQLRNERKYSSNLLFIITSQKGKIFSYYKLMKNILNQSKLREDQLKSEKSKLINENYRNVHTLTQLSINPNYLFEFFTIRLANICGANKLLNNELAQKNNAIMVLSALCKSPREIIRKYASRALGNIGWDGFIERKILIWDAMMYWKLFQSKVFAEKEVNDSDYQQGQDIYLAMNTGHKISTKHTERDEVASNSIDEFNLLTGLSPTNASVRTIIKHRRQYALRAFRRSEGPNASNQRLINMEDGIIPSLLDLCDQNNMNDWEIARNAVLAICIASYEPKNHFDMIHNVRFVELLSSLCRHHDPEVQTHAAITIANLSCNDEYAQIVFGGSQQSISNPSQSIHLSDHDEESSKDHGKSVNSIPKERSKANELNVIPQLLSICSSSSIPDLLEASTAALANLTCLCDLNCSIVLHSNGLQSIIKLIVHCHTENALDLDQNDEIQANAAEILANTSRYYSLESIQYFDNEIIDSLILMCGSRNIQVKRHIPLVIGNISQSERCREELGQRGAIEALFLTLEDIPIDLPSHKYQPMIGELVTGNWEADPTMQANVLWALCNLMWHPANQERAGRFLKEIIDLSHIKRDSHVHHPVRIYAMTLLANMVYYNNNNRVRFLEYEGSLDLLMSFIDPTAIRDHPFNNPRNNSNQSRNSQYRRVSNSQIDSEAINQENSLESKEQAVDGHSMASYDLIIVENALRALLSLSYLDYVSTWLIVTKNYTNLLLQYLQSPVLSNDIVRFTLGIISNITISYEHRKILFDAGGLSILIDLHLHDDKSIVELAQDVISRLEDVSSPEDLAKKKVEIGLHDMIQFATNSDPLIRVVAAESIGEEIWFDKSKQKLAIDQGGVEALLHIITAMNESIDSVLPSIWSLRNLLHHNHDGQHQYFMIDGIGQMMSIFKRCASNDFQDKTLDVLEACLSCIATAIMNHTGNSRRLLVTGMETINDMIDRKYLDRFEFAEDFTRQAFHHDTIISLCKSILFMLGPYNYVVCRNCQRKQELSGTNCSQCGHRLRIDSNTKSSTSPTKKRSNTNANRDNRLDSPIKDGLLSSKSEKFDVLSTQAVGERQDTVKGRKLSQNGQMRRVVPEFSRSDK